MKKNLLILITFCTLTVAYGQKQANIWYFGNGVGLDFNTECDPTILTDGAIDGFEGCATISDKLTGQLLFYTNSAFVWDRNHNIMTNGNLVTNGNTITQVTIIQKPGFNSIYYIVTSEVQGFSGQGYRFHQIDMTLNGGLGGVSFKDSLLYLSPVTEKITAVRHSNGTDIWLIGHQYNSDKFLSFKATSSGINKTPIVSAIGKIHFDNSTSDAIGEMKASPDGKKLSVVTLVHPNIELFDFDNATGQVSNLITLPETGGYNLMGNVCGMYGVSFSSDNSKLYASEWLSPSAGVSSKIIQYDITSNDSAVINNSRVNIFTSEDKNLYSLKLAPNRKIYVGKNGGEQYLGVINSPNSAGLNCNYIDSALYCNGKLPGWGLNNLMEQDDYCVSVAVSDYTKKNQKINISPNPFSTSTTFQMEIPLKNTTLIIYNSFGQTVKEINNISGELFTLHRGDLPNGLFFIRVTQDKKMLAMSKLIITD